MITVILLISMIYPLTMIIIGAINLESCPINNLIPVWLVVSGSGAILIEILIAFFIAYTIFRFFIPKSYCERLSIILCIILPIIIIFIFNIGWFFAGIYYFRFLFFFLKLFKSYFLAQRKFLDLLCLQKCPI